LKTRNPETEPTRLNFSGFVALKVLPLRRFRREALNFEIKEPEMKSDMPFFWLRGFQIKSLL